MATFTAAEVQALRKQTGAGMLDAKKALEEAEGDSGRAAQILRERGLSSASKREDRDNSQGACLVVVLEHKVGALVELKCETDFVAKSGQFIEVLERITNAVARDGVDASASFASEIEQLRLTLKENISLGSVTRFEAASGEAIEGYLHIQSDRGVNGVLVHMRDGSLELGHEIALHIAFSKPPYLAREDIPSDIVDQERKTLETLTRNEGKPEAALTKIVEGRLDGFFKQNCLLEQVFVKDEKMRVSQALRSAQVIAYAQVVVGG